MRTAYLEGRSIARDHDVSCGAVRTAVADLLPEYSAAAPDAPAPELPRYERGSSGTWHDGLMMDLFAEELC